MLLSISCVAQIYPPTYPEDRFLHGSTVIGKHTMQYTMPVDAYVLSSVTGDIDPFYHASGLLLTVPSFTFDSILTLRMRIAAECWNFSAAYQSPQNMILWAKPSVTLSVPVSAIVDSVRLTAGDLWRVRVGEGLALDQFESFGATLRVVTGRIAIEATTIGYGWTGGDDIYTMSIQMDSIVRLNGFMNFGGSFPNALSSGTGQTLISIDAHADIAGFHCYSEIGVANGKFAALGGCSYKYQRPSTVFMVRAEGRYYPRGFFPAPTTADGYPSNPYPYVNSLTALDKSVMSYRSFASRGSGYIIQLFLRQEIIGPLFIGMESEYFRGLYTDTHVGVSVSNVAEITIGYMNKAFRLYTDGGQFQSMFTQTPMALLRTRARL